MAPWTRLACCSHFVRAHNGNWWRLHAELEFHTLWQPTSSEKTNWKRSSPLLSRPFDAVYSYAGARWPQLATHEIEGTCEFINIVLWIKQNWIPTAHSFPFPQQGASATLIATFHLHGTDQMCGPEVMRTTIENITILPKKRRRLEPQANHLLFHPVREVFQLPCTGSSLPISGGQATPSGINNWQHLDQSIEIANAFLEINSIDYTEEVGAHLLSIMNIVLIWAYFAKSIADTNQAQAPPSAIDLWMRITQQSSFSVKKKKKSQRPYSWALNDDISSMLSTGSNSGNGCSQSGIFHQRMLVPSSCSFGVKNHYLLHERDWLLHMQKQQTTWTSTAGRNFIASLEQISIWCCYLSFSFNLFMWLCSNIP